MQAKRRQQDSRDSYGAPKIPKYQRVDTVVRVEDNICTYRYGEILHASAVLLKLFMSDRDYMSTGEDLHFLFRVCK